MLQEQKAELEWMKRAKAEIVQTSRGGSKYSFSILEKQNDSGIMFNERLFFLLDRQHIGYISDTKNTEITENINFDKPKNTALLSNIKSITINATQLTLRFNLVEGNKKSERVWILKTEKEVLTRQWYDLLQRQKLLVSSSQTISPKKPQLPQAWTLSPKKEQSPRKKQLTISRHLELSENSKLPPKEKPKDKEFKEIGIGMSPKHNQQKKIELKDPEEKLKEIIKEPPKKQEYKQPQKPPQKSPRALNKPIQKQTEKTIQKPLEKAGSQKAVDKSKQTLQQTSRRDISELQKSTVKSPSSSMRPTLVNTKYLTNQKAERQHNIDYMQRTHELIKSLDPDRSHRNTSRSILKEIQEEPIPTTRRLEKTVKLEKTEDWPEIPWTYKYIKYGGLIFKQFETQTQSLMKELVLEQSRKRGDFPKFKPKLIKNGIHYYDIGDIEVKMAFIGLEDLDTSSSELQAQRVCNKRPVKALQNQFNNFKALYEYLGVQEKLRVPLVSLCFHNGFVALFKATSKSLKKSIRFKQIQYELSQLQKRSKIQGNFIQSLNNIIIQLDEGYYQQFREGEEDKTCFNLFFIQEIEQFLLPDLITDSPNQHVLLLRKELIDNYRINAPPIKKDISFFKENPHKSAYSKQLETFCKNILVALSEVIVQMDSFKTYFLNSTEFSHFLHAKGVNIRYLGHLYQNLKAQFQRRFVMTEMAARSCKSLFRKTLQDLGVSEEAPRDMELHCKICDFLNCILGNTFETAAIWKVLSTHSRAYFGVELNFDQIDRNHLIVALIDNLKLEVVWDKVRPEEAFKSNIFFSQKNLIGIAIYSKTYPPIFTALYKNTVKILQREQSFSGFDTLVAQLSLKTRPIPEQLGIIDQQIRRYLSFFISPAKNEEYPQLHLYDSCLAGRPSKAKFDLLLMWIKWALREGQREEYIRICDSFIRAATRYYGEFHPVFSQLYELFSAYHLGNFQHQDAITFAKSSLVNMLRVCGSNHQRTAECYFHLALCYIRSGRREEGAAHIRKSLAILDMNGRTETPAYAVIQLKLGMLLLSQGHPEECAQRVLDAQSIFEAKMAENSGSFEDEITECLQLLARCYQLLQWRAEAKELLVQCQARLKKTTHPRNLQKVLKVYLYPLLSGLSPEQASHYLDIISLFPVDLDENNSETAFGLLRSRIAEESLLPCFKTCLGKLQNIEQHVRQKGMLRGWANFSEVYERETVKDFLALTVQLLSFLGEGFLSGVLREAL